MEQTGAISCGLIRHPNKKSSRVWLCVDGAWSTELALAPKEPLQVPRGAAMDGREKHLSFMHHSHRHWAWSSHNRQLDGHEHHCSLESR